MPADTGRFDRAIAAFDAANAADPVTITAGGKTGPREAIYAKMATEWVRRLRPDAGELLLLAARAHHIRRWEVPRASYPEGRTGYLRWRTQLQVFHANAAAEILAREGYSDSEIERVASLIRKKGLGTDPDAQTLEDAVCLVFLEAQFAPFAAKMDREKMVDILRRTWRKMSPAGQAAALALAFAPEDRALVEAALAG